MKNTFGPPALKSYHHLLEKKYECRTKAQVLVGSMAVDSLYCLTSFSGVSSFTRFKPRYHHNHHRHHMKKMVISMSSSVSVRHDNQVSHWLKSMNAEIDAHVAKSIPLRPPPSVLEPMQYLVFSAPRSLAPALCLAACELVGGQRDQAIAAASALHVIHAAAFVHENLPLSNRPSTGGGHKYKPNIELLTGDGILPFGYELIARSGDSTSSFSEKILRVIIEIAKVSGGQGMVDGQYDVMMQRMNGHGHGDNHGNGHGHGWVREVSEKKEGRFCGCGAACGAILGGGSEVEIQKLRNYGKYVGMAHGMTKMMDQLFGGSSSSSSSSSSLLLKELLEEVKRLRFLGMKELQSFRDRDVEAISGLMEEESFLFE